MNIDLNIFEWENDTRIFRNGQVLRVGEWVVGEVCHETRPKGENNNYAAKSYLPGLKETLDYYETIDQAKNRVESATKKWISKLYINKT